MPRRLLKKICPSPGALQKRWYLRPFGDRIADPRLWTLHRRAVTSAFGVGLAIAFIPLPVHMLVAGLVAIACRINFPAIYGATLLVNPITCVPDEPPAGLEAFPARVHGLRRGQRPPGLAHPRAGLALARNHALSRET
jgi:uncharacterized protein DUF2062